MQYLDNKAHKLFDRRIISTLFLSGVKLGTDLELRRRYDKAFTEIKLLEDAGEYRTIYW